MNLYCIPLWRSNPVKNETFCVNLSFGKRVIVWNLERWEKGSVKTLSVCSRTKTWRDGIRRSFKKAFSGLHSNHVDCVFLKLNVLGKNKLTFNNLVKFAKCNSTRSNHPYELSFKPAKCNTYIYSLYPNRAGLE